MDNTIECAACGTENEAVEGDFIFCRNCGALLSTDQDD